MPRRLQGAVGAITAESHKPGQQWVTIAKRAQRWWVQFDGGRQRECYPTLTQAIHRGLKLAHQHKPAGLIIHHCNGEEELHWIEEECAAT